LVATALRDVNHNTTVHLDESADGSGTRGDIRHVKQDGHSTDDGDLFGEQFLNGEVVTR
jgi:hypothetical protein